MTDEPTSQPRGPRIQRVRLGNELRRLRALAGISGRGVAAQLKIGQASISRLENGQAVPSLPQVNAWADAVGATEEQRTMLVALTEAALNEVETWRARMREGLPAMQDDVSDLEESARLHLSFQPVIVPGLLQIADYARRVFELVDVLGGGDYAGAVARRLERQRILYADGHRFEFVLTEAALRLRIVPPQVMAAQLAHIGNVATLENVDVRVVLLDAESTVIPWCSFTIYDECGDLGPFVRVELPHVGVHASDLDDVELYRRQHAELRRSAVPYARFRQRTTGA